MVLVSHHLHITLFKIFKGRESYRLPPKYWASDGTGWVYVAGGRSKSRTSVAEWQESLTKLLEITSLEAVGSNPIKSDLFYHSDFAQFLEIS